MSEATEWCSVNEAFPLFRRFFRTKKAMQYHISRRAENGLEDCDAVRRTPLGMIVNPPRFKAWLLGERQDVA